MRGVNSRCAVLGLSPRLSWRQILIIRVRSPAPRLLRRKQTVLLLRVPVNARLGFPNDHAIERELLHGLRRPVEDRLARLARLVRLVWRCRRAREARLVEVLREAIIEGLVLLVVGEILEHFLRGGLVSRAGGDLGLGASAGRQRTQDTGQTR